MFTIKVVWKDTGKPAKHERVSVGFSGFQQTLNILTRIGRLTLTTILARERSM